MQTSAQRCFSPSFNLTAAGVYTLRFRKSMDVLFSNAPYGVLVEYSTDQGISWQRLGIDGDPLGTNWYDRGPNSGTIHLVTPGGYAWDNNYTNQLTEYDISFLAGNSSVCFRVAFYCGSSFTATGYLDGFMVDDFEVLGEDNDQVLPVELTAFSLAPLPAENAIRLEWSTASEVANSHWFIERKDGQGEFRRIRRIDGQGTTPVASHYEYVDAFLIIGQTYTYRLQDVAYDGTVTIHPPQSILLEAGDNEPAVFELSQNYPNPFNPVTTITYTVPEESRVKLTIYNLLGETVRVLVDERRQAGQHQVFWDASDASGQQVGSGIYLYRLQARDITLSKQMIYLR